MSAMERNRLKIRHTKFEIHHLKPAWFIPIVGNVLVPIAGAQHGFMEIAWFFFSIGIVMWITLFAIVFNRIYVTYRTVRAIQNVEICIEE